MLLGQYWACADSGLQVLVSVKILPLLRASRAGPGVWPNLRARGQISLTERGKKLLAATAENFLRAGATADQTGEWGGPSKKLHFEINGSMSPNNGQKLAPTGQNRG